MPLNYLEKDKPFLESIRGDVRILLVTANEIEKQTLHQMLSPFPGETQIFKFSIHLQTYYVGIFGKYMIAHVACGTMGSSGREASINTVRDAIQDLAPAIVIMPGVSFGYNRKKQRIGDVLVSEKVTNYEPQRVGADGVIARGEDGPAGRVLLNKFKNVTGWRELVGKRVANIYYGQIISGEKLVDNSDFKETFLTRYPEAIGGEMEGSGVYSACSGRVTEWILVKGICDFADGKKKRNKKENQKIAARCAFSLCHLILSSENNFVSLGVLPISDVDKSITAQLLDRMVRQITRQLTKQVNSGKYLRETFLEVGSAKDFLRYLCDPVFYARKCADKINELDFRYLNIKLQKKGLPLFKFDFAPRYKLVNDLNLVNLSAVVHQWITHLDDGRKQFATLGLRESEQYPFSYKFSDNTRPLEFLRAKVGLVTETAGQGKTNFICDFVENFLGRKQIPCVFLTGVELDPVDLRVSILKKIDPDGSVKDLSFANFIQHLETYCTLHNNCFVIVIDGINENADPIRLSTAMEAFIEEMMEHNFVRIILTCRTEYYENNFSNFDRSSFMHDIVRLGSLHLRRGQDGLKKKLFDKYFTHFNVTYSQMREEPERQLMSNFLLLRIFCESYQGTNIGVLSNIYKEELFRNYFLRKTTEINEQLKYYTEYREGSDIDIKKFFIKLIGLMIDRRTYGDISLDDVLGSPIDRQLYIRFLDENILVKRDLRPAGRPSLMSPEVVNFTFDEFRDYLISDYLVNEMYPRSVRQFEMFVDSELGDRSMIKEGCTRFLFYVAKRVNQEKLNLVLRKRKWYSDVFTKCIFNLPDQLVNREDKVLIFELLKSSNGASYGMVFKLICRYDMSVYQNLNIRDLIDFLSTAETGDFNESFVNAFGNDAFSSRLIDQVEFLAELDSIIDTTPIGVDNGLHNVFEMVIYMFTNSNQFEPFSTYEKYYFKNKTIAISQIRRALLARNMRLVESINKFLRQYGIKL